ncbi:uncharacterized protein Z518_05716 [Rhinocladiella mackenziei CBS 650.93]|uniref:Uncharacterized protein n=1 Tax=Rhinocladiella mackenziei CBS 650.93 TaxID=1442369 RepID=A0A0D2J6Y8_9EURO|nr:uncharacterized protein Z518_05716 [Rhinocladiella mackenziei CBS 650.93]KIX04845.1 hypothetical protein Z518_05716 [Rhinocladiella mackenziei CBS 650.93]
MTSAQSTSSIFSEEYIAEQRKVLPVLATTETCSGATYIVTGANVGLGFEAAKHLVKLGAAKVIIAVRNVQAGEAAKAEIEAEAEAVGVLEVWPLDLASFDSVKVFAKRANDELNRIDALIENAGVSLDKWKMAEGHESSITINVLGTFLLGILLFPKMMESARRFNILPHLVIVTSEVSFTAKEPFDKIKDDPLVKLDNEEIQGMVGRYPLSKLIQVLAVRYLATLLPVSRTGVVVNLVNSGLCKTNLIRKLEMAIRTPIEKAQEQFGRTAEMGSRTLLHAAVAEKESHGCYLSACEIKENQVPEWVTNEEGKQAQKRVWDDIAKELDSLMPGCVKILL